MYDMNKLKRLKKMDRLAPAGMKAFWKFDAAAMADGAIPPKMKQLIALAVAHTTQCPYCIEIHSTQAREAGATDAEIVEAVIISAALRAGAAIVHGTHCLSD
ncbi:MAG: carboxymuconolactone decarboxylase family protein [Burkholderiales bacterium]